MKLDQLVCPYNECKREFDKPLMLTDFSITPRETYYACPHCLTRVAVVAEDSRLSSVCVETSNNPVERTPAECAHHFGYLIALPKTDPIPDQCLTCTKLLQCLAKKEKIPIEVK